MRRVTDLMEERAAMSPVSSRAFRAAHLTLLTAAALACAPLAQAASGAFVVTALGDTIAVERYTRSPARFEGALVFRLGRLRFDYAIDLEPSGGVVRMVNHARPSAAPVALPPTQSATLVWQGDSVDVDIQPGKHERLGSRAGSYPYLNPSIALLELIVQHALASSPPLASVPVFAVTGGRTLEVALRYPAADSVIVSFGVVEFWMRMAPDGRLLDGLVPTQMVRFERLDALPEGLLAVAPLDYSGPVDAPYTSEAVRVPTRGGFSLAGTLAWPKRPGRQPVAVLLTGSGPQDRDETISIVKGFRPFRQLADTLARRGIAVLRLDDRGTGESGGVFGNATTQDFADDAEDAVRWLRTLKDIDTTRIALVGHSEGGLIAPMVAARGTRLAAIALLAGPAWPGRRIVHDQNLFAARKAYSGAVLDSVMRSADAAVDSIGLTNRWYGFFLEHDPIRVARKLRSPPVLILQGETDRQVSAGQADELAVAFKLAGNRDVTVHRLPATNHLFLPDSSGDPAGYSNLPVRDLAPATMGLLADWLATRLKVGAKPR